MVKTNTNAVVNGKQLLEEINKGIESGDISIIDAVNQGIESGEINIEEDSVSGEILLKDFIDKYNAKIMIVRDTINDEHLYFVQPVKDVQGDDIYFNLYIYELDYSGDDAIRYSNIEDVLLTNYIEDSLLYYIGQNMSFTKIAPSERGTTLYRHSIKVGSYPFPLSAEIINSDPDILSISRISGAIRYGYYTKNGIDYYNVNMMCYVNGARGLNDNDKNMFQSTSFGCLTSVSGSTPTYYATSYPKDTINLTSGEMNTRTASSNVDITSLTITDNVTKL